MKLASWTVGLLCPLVLACLASPVSAQPISIEGSDTLGEKLVPALVAAYQAAGHAVQFNVTAEGSSNAFTGLESGSAQVGMSSRPIKDAERQSLQAAGKSVDEHVAGIDMIAVIVNADNPIEDIPLEGIDKIFSGEVGTWKTLPGEPAILPVTRDETSGTFKVFQELAMGDKSYGPTCQKMDGNGAIASKVAAELAAVGYVGLSSASGPGIKTVRVDGVAAEPANASTYPLSRKLFYYTVPGQTSEEAMAFLTWAMTAPEAAEIITKIGFLPPQ